MLCLYSDVLAVMLFRSRCSKGCLLPLFRMMVLLVCFVMSGCVQEGGSLNMHCMVSEEAFLSLCHAMFP